MEKKGFAMLFLSICEDDKKKNRMPLCSASSDEGKNIFLSPLIHAARAKMVFYACRSERRELK